MPSAKELAKALAYRGEIRNTPQNRFLGGVADALSPVSEFADQYKISDRIPFLGGMSAADLTGLKGAQSLVNDMSYGKPPIRGATLNTVKVDPRLLDLAGVSGAMMPVGKALGKAALREGARQIETGTGVLGRNVMNPRMSVVPEGASMPQRPKTEFEILHDTAQRNAALPVEQGGLGLPEGNTAMDRAGAMGFDTPAYHGTKGDIREFDLKSSGASTNTKDIYKQSVSVTNDPSMAGDYALHANIRGHKRFIDDLSETKKKIASLRKKERDMYKGKISKDEYEKLARDAYDTSNYEFNADTPGMSGFAYGSQYAKTDQNIMPLRIKKGINEYPEKWNQTVIKNGIKNTNLPVTFNNVPDILTGLKPAGYLHNTTIIQDPSHIRSRFAAFDPFRRHEADILAGVGVGGMLDPQAIAEALRQKDRK